MVPLAERVGETEVKVMGLIIVVILVPQLVLVILKGIHIAEAQAGLVHRETDLKGWTNFESGIASLITGGRVVIGDAAWVIIIESAERR